MNFADLSGVMIPQELFAVTMLLLGSGITLMILGTAKLLTVWFVNR